jgi:hypothetical protein
MNILRALYVYREIAEERDLKSSDGGGEAPFTACIHALQPTMWLWCFLN